MNNSSLCALVIIAVTSCGYRTSYTPPPEVITRHVFSEKPCPPAEKIVETLPCEQKTEEKVTDQLSTEYRALLDTIAWAEGTDCHYNMMVGRMLFTDYSSHPLETGEMPAKGIPFTMRGRKYWKVLYSTAAGRYQFLYRTYLVLKNEAGLFQTGFNPEEQDKAGQYLIKDKQGVTEELLRSAMETRNFIEIWNQLSWQWASLPCDDSKKPRKERKRCYPGRGRHKQFAYSDQDLQKIFFYFYDLRKK